MCGLFGMLGPDVESQDLEMLYHLAYISALRGGDATGICQGKVIGKRYEYFVEKETQEAPYFLWYSANDKRGNPKVLNDLFANFFIGHARAATRGAVTKANSHPFDIKHIIGAHNGTLKDKKYESKDKTDSELMFQDITERGLPLVLYEMDKDSAYAITMFDKKEKEVIIVKNSHRPLVYAWNTKRNVLYWTSEAAMMNFAANRTNTPISTIFKFSDGDVYSINPSEPFPKTGYPFYRKEFRKMLPKGYLEEKEPEAPVVLEPTDGLDGVSGTESVNSSRENLTHLLTNSAAIPTMGQVVPLVPRRLAPSLPVIRSENKPPLNLHKRKADNALIKKAKALLASCIYCQREMDLWAQYVGVCVDKDMYCCAECDQITNEINSKGMLH